MSANKNVSFSVAVADPDSPLHFIKPNADGSINVATAPGGTESVNLTQVGGVAVAKGSGAAATALRVELPTDGTGKVGLNAGTSIVGKFGIDQTTQGTTNGVVGLASEAHTGQVGGTEATILVAQTVTAASAYASGNCVGGLITIAGAARVAAGSGLIQSATINSKSAQTTQMDLIFFSANPTGSTITDKTALSVAAADFDKVLGVAHITDWTNLGTPSIGQGQNLAMPFVLPAGTTLYAALVTRSTPTFTATTDISVGVRTIQN